MDLLERLKRIKDKYDRINQQLADPSFMNERDKIVSLSRERSELEDIIKVYEEYSSVLNNIDGNKDIIDNGSDKELTELALAELKELEVKKEELEDKVKYLLLPKDPDDNKNVIMEIRAGTGGEEAALFAGDLFRMYSRYAERKGFKIELIDISDSGRNGIKEAVFSVN